MDLQGNPFEMDLFVLPIQGADIVLAVQWLQLLGNIVTNYKEMTMSFPWNGKTITLTGESPLSTAPILLNQFKRLSVAHAIASCFQLINLPPNQPLLLNSSTIPTKVQQVLDEFQTVFATPTALPPCRPEDHQIILEPNTKPTHVKPYRYLLGSIPMWLCLPQGEGAPLLPFFLYFGARFSAMF